MSQAKRILDTLERNGEGFLVAQRLDGRWSVELASGLGVVGGSIAEVLAEVATAIALERPWVVSQKRTIGGR